jgi:hypothetical protein
MDTYREVVEQIEGAADGHLIDGNWDILTSGFHECSLYAISFTKEGSKLPTSFKVRDILYISGKGTCTVSPDGIDFMATLQNLLLGNVSSLLIIGCGKESHMWGARYHPEAGRWWYHSNHEQGVLTQGVFEREIREVAHRSAISIKQLVPDAGKANTKKSDHAMNFDWITRKPQHK